MGMWGMAEAGAPWRVWGARIIPDKRGTTSFSPNPSALTLQPLPSA